jgi:hypothetical protein
VELTVRYLRERFQVLNVEYFSGELPMPQLVVSNARTQLGQFSCTRYRKNIFSRSVLTNFKIKISEYYEQTAEEIDDTLLHEMIHYLLAYRGQRDTSAHGPLFRKEMARLNAMGRHLTISARTTKMAVNEQNVRRQHLVLAMEGRDGQCYLSVVHPSYKRYVERLLPFASQIVDHHWVVSSDDYFNSFPQARSLRGRRVTRTQYDEVIRVAHAMKTSNQ